MDERTSKPKPIEHKVEKLLYDKKAAAFALSISVRKLEYLIAQKRINSTGLDGKVMIRAGELKRFSGQNHHKGENGGADCLGSPKAFGGTISLPPVGTRRGTKHA